MWLNYGYSHSNALLHLLTVNCFVSNRSVADFMKPHFVQQNVALLMMTSCQNICDTLHYNSNLAGAFEFFFTCPGTSIKI